MTDLSAHPFDQFQNGLQLGLGKFDSSDHHVFREFVGARLDHQHRVFRGRDGQLEGGVFQRLQARVEHIVAPLITDADTRGRAVPGDI